MRLASPTPSSQVFLPSTVSSPDLTPTAVSPGAAPTPVFLATTPGRRTLSARGWFGLSGIVLLALALRLPFLMHSLDERDSSNFALSAINFDVLTHQPHPPGQFYYAMLCQAMHSLVPDEVVTVSLLGALFSSLALIPYFFILRRVFDRTLPAFAATVLTAFSFGFWLTGLRPISDPVGCFFVYTTVCALLYGLDSPRWFCAGMALFALQLGVKQLSVYFLAPLVLVVNLIVLLKYGWRPFLAGAFLFAVVFLGWLLPTVLNVGDWHRFLEISQRQQAASYFYESLVTHFSSAEAQLHATHDLVWLWGFEPLAVVMLGLAVVGFLPFWGMGLRARLFTLFGATTVLYILLVLGTFSKYYVYTAPVYCAFVAAGLYWLSSRPLFNRIFAQQRSLLLAGTGMLALVELCVAVPRLGEIKAFRSPVQAAYDSLVRTHGPDLRGINVLTNQEGAVAASLRYYQAKSGLNFADFDDYFDYVVPELGARKELYLFSFLSGGGSTKHLELVNTFVWKNTLRKILQATPTDYRLFVYKVHDQLPDTYHLEDGQLEPLLFSRHIDTDGWVAPDCDMILPGVAGSPHSFIRLQGTVAGDLDLQQPLQVRYQVRSRSADTERTFTLAKPGPFSVLLSLDKPRAASVIGVNFATTDPGVLAARAAAGDSRHLTWRVNDLQCTVASHPLLVSYVDGTWYDVESTKTSGYRRSVKPHSWRWCQEEGKVELGAGRDGTLVIDMTLLSTKEANHVDVLLDNETVAAVDVPIAGTMPPQTLRVPLSAGLHTLAFRGQIPGEQPNLSDQRLLSIGVQDLHLNLE